MAGEDANGGGGEALPAAGAPLLEMERLTHDEAYNLVMEERLDPETGQWRDVSLDGPAPELPSWMEYGDVWACGPREQGGARRPGEWPVARCKLRPAGARA